jgi:hypothetical protein
MQLFLAPGHAVGKRYALRNEFSIFSQALTKKRFKSRTTLAR